MPITRAGAIMGKYVKTIILTGLLLVGSGAVVTAQETNAPRKVDFYGTFYGRWEGKFARVPEPVFDPNPNTTPLTDIAFYINSTGVRVYLKPKPDGDWTEAKPGSFQIVSDATNAVIFSISGDHGPSHDPTDWVETWNFTITHKERDSLYVFVTRAVNNFAHPYDYLSPNGRAPGRFFHILYGEMTHPD